MNKVRVEMLFMILKGQGKVKLSALKSLMYNGPSKRVLRSNIDHINDFLKARELAELVVYRNDDVEYTGNTEQRKRALHLILNQVGMDYYGYRLGSKERVRVIVCYMIERGNYVSCKDLCTVVHVSRATLYSDMKRCRKITAEYGLNLLSRPSMGYIIRGHEWDKREALCRLKKRWCEKDELTYSEYRPILSQLEEKEGFVFSDRGYTETLRYIDISLERIRKGFEIDVIPDVYKDVSIATCERSKYIWGLLTSKVKLIPSEKEIVNLEIRLRMSGKIASKSICVHGDAVDLSDSFMEKILQTGRALRCTEESKARLYAFMETMFYGVNREYSSNPMVEKMILRAYPDVVEAVYKAKRKLERSLNRNISKREIYQLILFATSMVKSSNCEGQVPKVLIVCDGSPGEVDLLHSQVRRLFFVDIIGVIGGHAITRYKNKDINLIISTVPLALNSDGIPVVYVTPYLNCREVGNIQSNLFECECMFHDFQCGDVAAVGAKDGV